MAWNVAVVEKTLHEIHGTLSALPQEHEECKEKLLCPSDVDTSPVQLMTNKSVFESRNCFSSRWHLFESLVLVYVMLVDDVLGTRGNFSLEHNQGKRGRITSQLKHAAKDRSRSSPSYKAYHGLYFELNCCSLDTSTYYLKCLSSCLANQEQPSWLPFVSVSPSREGHKLG